MRKLTGLMILPLLCILMPGCKEQAPDPLHRFDGVLPVTERCQPEVMLPGRSESGSRRTDDMCMVQKMIKEFPACHLSGRAQPDIRCVDASRYFIACRLQSVIDDSRIFHIVSDLRKNLPPPLFGVNRLSRALDDIRRPIVFGAMAPRPQRPQLRTFHLQFFRNHREAQTQSGESCCLRK